VVVLCFAYSALLCAGVICNTCVTDVQYCYVWYVFFRVCAFHFFWTVTVSQQYLSKTNFPMGTVKYIVSYRIVSYRMFDTQDVFWWATLTSITWTWRQGTFNTRLKNIWRTLRIHFGKGFCWSLPFPTTYNLWSIQCFHFVKNFS